MTPDPRVKALLYSENIPEMEKSLMYMEQFLKGGVQRVPVTMMALFFKIVIKFAKAIVDMQLEDVQGINEAYDRGNQLMNKLIDEFNEMCDIKELGV
jgi:hypothetical protein